MEEDFFQPCWTIRDGVIAIITVLAVMFIFGQVAGQIVGAESPNLFMLNFMAAVLQTGLLMGLPIYIAVQRCGHSLGDLGFIPGGLRQSIIPGVRWGIGLFILVVLAGVLLTMVYPSQPEPQDFAKLILLVDSPWKLFLAVVMGVVLAPLGEELFFRGFFYPAVRSRWGISRGIIITALFFAALHFDLYRLLPIAAGGAGLTYLYEKTGNIWTNIVAHGVWNGIMIALLVVTYRITV